MSRKRNGLFKNLKRMLNDRYFYIVLAVIAVMATVIVRLFVLQIVEGETHQKEVTENSLVALEIETPRGDIYDRNGVLIATVYTVYRVNMTYVATPQAERDSMYLELINLLERNNEDHINSIGTYLSSPGTWSKSLSEDEKKRSTWINEIAIKKSDRDNILTAKDAFDYLRKNVFSISDGYTDEEAYKIMEIRYETYKYGLSSITPMVLADGVSTETMAEIEAKHLDFPGISTEPVYKRQYVNSEYAGNVIGYVRAINNEEYEEMKDLGYSFNDIIGKTGIEKAEEEYLSGTKGKRYVYYDKATSSVKEYATEEPVPGDDLYLSIDLNLQKISYEALEEAILKIASEKDGSENFGDANAGAVIVEDVKTGEILAMASYPTYDISLFLRPSSDSEAQQAITDLFSSEGAPTLNRATQGLYAIGSTFKPVVASAGLETGKITADTKYLCEGSVIIANRIHNCLRAHGEINVVTAIRQSCNVFFQRSALEIGISTLDAWAKDYGLGEKTGIEISEYAGNRSNPETMKLKEADETHVWSDSDTAQTAIGQLYTLFTPIQLVNYTSALANGGYVNTPRLVNRVVAKDGSIVFEKENSQRHISISRESLAIINQGMREMINNNEEAQSEMVSFKKDFIAGKTGTPETGLEAYGQSSNAVFICFAPADEPEIAIAVVIEHGVWGSNAISVAARILETYFAEDISGNDSRSKSIGLTLESEFRDLKKVWEQKIAEKEENQRKQNEEQQKAAEEAGNNPDTPVVSVTPDNGNNSPLAEEP